MLILTRKPGQSIVIDLTEGLDPKTPVGELFARGPIEILVCGYTGQSVRLGVEADSRFRILRDELCEEPAAVYGSAGVREPEPVD